MRVLVDSSAWIEYLRGGAAELDQLLPERKVVTHPTVIGELSCGSIKNRSQFIGDLKLLPRLPEAGFDEILGLIESQKLHGKGLGFGDIQLLASAMLSDSKILTFDKALRQAAQRFQISYP